MSTNRVCGECGKKPGEHVEVKCDGIGCDTWHRFDATATALPLTGWLQVRVIGDHRIPRRSETHLDFCPACTASMPALGGAA